MTEEKIVLRQIAETAKRVAEQNERIERLMTENQPTGSAAKLLGALWIH